MAMPPDRAPERADAPTGWTAGAMVFSGRPDPEWSLAPTVAATLMALWRRAAPSRRDHAVPARLGYRGCWIRSPEGARFRAFAGAIVRETEGALPEVRDDAGRTFERALLDTAPPGVLPPGATV